VSQFKDTINGSILKAMEVVPRHLFMEPAKVRGTSMKKKLEAVYSFDRPMGATEWSFESAPDIIGVQVKISLIYFMR
jgi:hypothetical protein